MNRIVLIGNGFDIAHGLKTSYADFIHWYWEQWGSRLLHGKSKEEADALCSFKLNSEVQLASWYLVWMGFYKYKRENPFIPWNAFDVLSIAKKDGELCDFTIKSELLKRIDKEVESKHWVDIENIYYEILVNTKNFGNQFQSLNNQLDFLKDKLIEYLILEGQKNIVPIEEINRKIFCPILETDISVEKRKSMLIEKSDGPCHILNFSYGKKIKKWTPRNIMLLNFNYTNTPQCYAKDQSNLFINNIHGCLDSPESVIFGYGDELDENYRRLKEQGNSECLRHVKSIRYLEHDNYRRMLEFIESDSFQVVIMGHSCGNSDRTLLNTLFEHRNCVSIKPYFYIKPDGTNSYSELTININRNFTDPKLMRDRVVNKEYCEPLT